MGHQTNPIFGGAGGDRASGTRACCAKQTQFRPWHVARGTDILPVSLDHRQDADATVPPAGGTTDLSETRRQLYQTNPIPGDGGWDRACARGRKSCETKPILRLRIGDRPAASGPRGSIAPNKPNLAARPGGQGPNVRNKANCPKRGTEAVSARQADRGAWNPPPYAGVTPQVRPRPIPLPGLPSWSRLRSEYRL
jgi:hypothetical protein